VRTNRRTEKCDDANIRFSYTFVTTYNLILIYVIYNLFYFYVYFVTINFVASLLRNTDHSYLF